jgi:hypothetical protein
MSLLPFSELFPNLNYSKVKLSVTLSRPITAPLSGSAWRGLMGWEISSLVCPFDRKKCGQCLIAHHCPYYQLIEAKTEYPGLFDSPRGYVVYCDHPAGSDALELEITLVGTCRRFFPVVLKSLDRGGRRGVGSARITYSVREVRALDSRGCWLSVHNLDQSLPILKVDKQVSSDQAFEIRTPVRMRRMGRYLNEMDWPFFFQVLARRMEALHCLYCDGQPFGKKTWKHLQEGFAKFGEIKGKVIWKDFSRYSNRQKRKVPMGGLVGKVDISTAEDWVATWMQAAQTLHLGKGAAMGFGRVEGLA